MEMSLLFTPFLPTFGFGRLATIYACMHSVLTSCFAEFVELSTEDFAGIQHDQLLY